MAHEPRAGRALKFHRKLAEMIALREAPASAELDKLVADQKALKQIRTRTADS